MADAVGSDRLGHAIKRAEQALIGRKNRVLRDYGLTVPQYAALLLLSESDGMSAAQLARGALVTPQTMMTVLTNLASKGLVEREPSPLHQKVLVTRLTPAGTTLLASADQAALAVEQALADAFTARELAQFRELLDRATSTLTALPTTEP